MIKIFINVLKTHRENGLKPIVLTVKDKETGVTTYGRTLVLEASYDLPDLILRVLGVVSVFVGGFLPIARIFKLPV